MNCPLLASDTMMAAVFDSRKQKLPCSYLLFFAPVCQHIMYVYYTTIKTTTREEKNVWGTHARMRDTCHPTWAIIRRKFCLHKWPLDGYYIPEVMLKLGMLSKMLTLVRSHSLNSQLACSELWIGQVATYISGMWARVCSHSRGCGVSTKGHPLWRGLIFACLLRLHNWDKKLFLSGRQRSSVCTCINFSLGSTDIFRGPEN